MLARIDNFIFPSSWSSSEWSFTLSRRPLDNYTGLSKVYKTCDISGSGELLLSVLRDHVLYSVSLPTYFTSNVLTQLFSLHGSFHSPPYQCSLFFVVAHFSLAYNVGSCLVLLWAHFLSTLILFSVGFPHPCFGIYSFPARPMYTYTFTS